MAPTPGGSAGSASERRREDEAVRLLAWNGAPLSCHLMLTAGPRAALGLARPG